MPFVPVNHVAGVQIFYTLDNQELENTLYFKAGTAITEALLITLGNDIAAWWTSQYGPLVSDDVQMRAIECTDLTTATGPQNTNVPGVAVFGEITSPALPNNVSLAVSFRTAQRGRSFRGRNYIVGLCEEQVENNTVSESIVGALQDAYEVLIDPATYTDDWQWVVVSRFSGVDPDTGKPIPRTDGVSTVVTSVVIVDSTIDSQRRRLPGRGR